MKRDILLLLILGIVFSSCEDQFSAADDNHLTFDEVYRNASVAEGLLMNAYGKVPNINGFSFSDVATDDAVSNQKTNSYRLMAEGQWTSMNNPMAQWSNALTPILYLNQFLDVADNVDWAPLSGETIAQLFKGRNMGEAYALRGLLLFSALQAHAGYDNQGKLLGVPIILESPDKVTNLGRPRASLDSCLQQVYSDFDEAEKYLPMDFCDITDSADIPARYAQLGASVEDYNRVFGNKFNLRVSARIVKGLRARVALWAASPAYNAGSWENAAKYAAESLNLIGGLSGVDKKGATYYLGTYVDKLDFEKDMNQKEILWRGGIGKSHSLESANFPPTLYGNGNVNPTQNLVDAFPMRKGGWPITDANSGYDAANPYANRDPRLANYIVCNGSKVSGTTISVENGAGDNAVNAISTSTRTGYYLRKFLREDVNLNPNSVTDQKHYAVVMRYTEIFLDYAEAANEAWGPDGKADNATYTAREVIAAIRKRAGIGPDTYLSTITTKDDMRALIHNERRLELCFEGNRFWDLRRWKSNITEPAMGITIQDGVIQPATNVEDRAYKDYMYYGPIPYSEVLKFNYSQNKGW